MKTTTFKKIHSFIALFAAFAMIFTGCKKDKDNNDAPNPGMSTITFYYTVTNIDNATSAVGSDCFHFNLSYKDADGNMVEVNDAELPWTKSITTTIPFEAKLQGTITYEEAEMPDDVYFIRGYQVSISPNESLDTDSYHGTKENIIALLNNNPYLLTFHKTFTYNNDWAK